MATAIHQATESVLIAVYALTDPYLIDACNGAARRGIPVSIATDRDHFQQLRPRLAQDVALIVPPGSGLMHRKLLVVDQRWVWIGSANYTSASLCLHDNLTIACDAPPRAQWLTRHYEALMQEEPPLPPYQVSFLAGDQEIQVWLMPESSALEVLLDQINQAKTSIRLALFAWTHPKLTRALQDAVQRGVRVEAVVDQAAARGSSRSTVQRALRAEIAVREKGGRALCHHKLALIDDEQLITGSANWTRSAFEKNRECVIRVAPLTETQRQRCNALWRQLTREEPATTAGPHWLWEDGSRGGTGRIAEGPSDCSPHEPEECAA
jgi:cardiolipin synthase A/B